MGNIELGLVFCPFLFIPNPLPLIPNPLSLNNQAQIQNHQLVILSIIGDFHF